MFKTIMSLLLLVLSLSLASCAISDRGLARYIDIADGYEFLYPHGWVQVQLTLPTDRPDVVFRDLIDQTENISVVISPIPEGKLLTDLGTFNF